MNMVRLSPHLGHLRCRGFDLGSGGVPATLGAKLLSADPAVTEHAAGKSLEMNNTLNWVRGPG